MSRDWQLDMERCKDFTSMDSKSVYIKALEYWLVQFAKWKEKAYEAEVKAHRERERADQAEEREQKLREAIEEIAAYPPFEETNNGDRFYKQMRETAKDILISLYPDKEEEV